MLRAFAATAATSSPSPTVGVGGCVGTAVVDTDCTVRRTSRWWGVASRLYPRARFSTARRAMRTISCRQAQFFRWKCTLRTASSPAHKLRDILRQRTVVSRAVYEPVGGRHGPSATWAAVVQAADTVLNNASAAHVSCQQCVPLGSPVLLSPPVVVTQVRSAEAGPPTSM